MKCPNCGKEMDKGKVTMEGTFFGSLLAGASYQHLFFTSDRNDKQVAVHCGDVRAANRCSSCNWLVIGGDYMPDDKPSYPPENDEIDADLFEPGYEGPDSRDFA